MPNPSLSFMVSCISCFPSPHGLIILGVIFKRKTFRVAWELGQNDYFAFLKYMLSIIE